MPTASELTAASKFLSFVLRHDPASIGLALDDAGWASIDELLANARRAGRRLSRELLDEVVATNAKQRFAISDDGLRIRANQGHSIRVDLGLVAELPPPVLYHGTASRFIVAIFREGLRKQQRHHVHLSGDVATARTVGARYGVPVILEVAARRMHAAGHVFYRSANGVWLTDAVPAQYLQRHEGGEPVP